MASAPLPAALPVGATVGLVAPASAPAAETVAVAEATLAGYGWQVRVYPGCHARYRPYAMQAFAGEDPVRAADLSAALGDPMIDGVITLRGGYGMPRLLDRIRWDMLGAPKVVLGYSDITALHVQLQNQGWISFHGPMAGTELIHAPSATQVQLLALLRGEIGAGSALWPSPPGKAIEVWVPGAAEGPLWGGNLCLLNALLGTPYAPCWPQGSILFIEEVNESAYRIDRMLRQWQQSGALRRLAGVLLGHFSPVEGETEADIACVLREYFVQSDLGIPVLAGLPAGHDCDTFHATLPLGARVAIRPDRHAAQVLLAQEVVRK